MKLGFWPIVEESQAEKQWKMLLCTSATTGAKGAAPLFNYLFIGLEEMLCEVSCQLTPLVPHRRRGFLQGIHGRVNVVLCAADVAIIFSNFVRYTLSRCERVIQHSPSTNLLTLC